MTTGTDKQKHIYPIQIALRTQRLIQGSMFYDVFMDTATGQYVRIIPNAEQEIKKSLIQNAGWSEDTYETSWDCFKFFLEEFKNPIFQHTVYSIISHWDWYISNLGVFIYFAEKHLDPNKQIDKDLLKVSSKPFFKQMEIIKNETGILLNLDSDTLDLVEEMHLVRNLGMHNEWNVDETYLKYSKTTNLKLGDKRNFDIPELTKWYSAFLQLIEVLTYEIATLYSQIPPFKLLKVD
jgi:hypothetical protein